MVGLVRPPHSKDAGQPTISGCQLQAGVIESIRSVIGDPLDLRLFGNDARLEAATLSSFREISGRGYAPKLLTPSLWSLTRVEKGLRLFQYAEQSEFVFSGTGPLTVYGWYVTRHRDGALTWAGRFYPPGAKPVDFSFVHNPGDAIAFRIIAPIWVGALGL